MAPTFRAPADGAAEPTEVRPKQTDPADPADPVGLGSDDDGGCDDGGGSDHNSGCDDDGDSADDVLSPLNCSRTANFEIVV